MHKTLAATPVMSGCHRRLRGLAFRFGKEFIPVMPGWRFHVDRRASSPLPAPIMKRMDRSSFAQPTVTNGACLTGPEAGSRAGSVEQGDGGGPAQSGHFLSKAAGRAAGRQGSRRPGAAAGAGRALPFAATHDGDRTLFVQQPHRRFADAACGHKRPAPRKLQIHMPLIPDMKSIIKRSATANQANSAGEQFVRFRSCDASRGNWL